MSLRVMAVVVAAGAALLRAAPAAAHEGRPLAPHDLARAWEFDPWILLGLGLLAWLYSRGLRAQWRTAPGRGIRRWEAAAFLVGWLVLVVALVSPVHALGEVLFSGHMVQHGLIMVLAAPLLVLGRPLLPVLWAMPMEARRALGGWGRTGSVRSGWRVVTSPLVAWLLHAVALWGWHLPSLYEATLRSGFVHGLQHASFLGSALLFWYAIMHGRTGRKGYGASVFYLFATALHSGGLGALLTFASRPSYPAYAEMTVAWGLTPLEDQQLAGLIMWIPGGVAYLVGGLLLLGSWMRESERRARRWRESGMMRPTWEEAR